MRIEINKKALDRFKKHAARVYPKEAYGILLGKKLANHRYVICDIHVPAVREAHYNYVIPDYDEIDSIVDSNPIACLGDIHSHPQDGAVVSPGDYKDWDTKDCRIKGILSIRKRLSYKTTELYFWQKRSACPVPYRYME